MDNQGDPQLLGVPIFVAGSVALGLCLIGYIPGDTHQASYAALPIIAFATAIGLLIATIWAAKAGQSFVACVFGVFCGFWASFPALVVGLVHGWWGIDTANADALKRAVALFLISWFVTILFLTLASVRLPIIYTVLLVLVEIALLLNIFGVLADDGSTLLKLEGFVVLAFAAVGAYIFMAVASLSLGGKGLPLGKPMVSG